jgi:DNA repair protein SbcC/Rad50
LTAEEARKEQLKARLEACELEGRGRKRLFELLESTRQTQIGEVTRVLSDRTLAWASHLGLDELRGLEFDTGYLPSGLHRRDLPSVQPLSSESFGTHEQLALLVRLAAGMALARDERQLAVLDDPLTHADVVKHQRMLDIFCQITRPTTADSGGAGGLQLFVLSCHPERYRRLPAHVPVVDLVAELERSRAEA